MTVTPSDIPDDVDEFAAQLLDGTFEAAARAAGPPGPPLPNVLRPSKLLQNSRRPAEGWFRQRKGGPVRQGPTCVDEHRLTCASPYTRSLLQAPRKTFAVERVTPFSDMSSMMAAIDESEEPAAGGGGRSLRLECLPPDILEQVFRRLSAVDLAEVCATSRALFTGGSLDSLWLVLLQSDFPSAAAAWPGCAALSPRLRYAAASIRTVESAVEAATADFQHADMESCALCFATVDIDGDAIPITQPVSHMALSRAIEKNSERIKRAAGRLKAGQYAHALATLEGISIGYMAGLHNLHHQATSQQYWQMWMDSFRALCDSWVQALVQHSVPAKLRRRYVAFAEGLDWDRNQIVGHWDAGPHVDINRVIGERVAAQCCDPLSNDGPTPEPEPMTDDEMLG